MPSPFVVQIDLKLESKLRAILTERGCALTQPPHTLFQAKQPHLSCTLYASGKLVIQGSQMEDFITYVLEPEILGTFTYHHPVIDESARMGVDESGKGDFFGPLCIAALFAPAQGVAALHQLGVKDSKKLTDATIVRLADTLQKRYAHHLVIINPERYNTLYQEMGNLNTLLGWGHATAIDALLHQVSCDRIIIDQFAHERVVEQALRRRGRTLHLEQRTHGEADLVVAAASILARAAFVHGLQQLSESCACHLPKGAGPHIVTAGKQLVARHGINYLGRVAKLHFKTTSEITEGFA